MDLYLRWFNTWVRTELKWRAVFVSNIKQLSGVALFKSLSYSQSSELSLLVLDSCGFIFNSELNLLP